jgi:anti-sigma factor RsiW
MPAKLTCRDLTSFLDRYLSAELPVHQRDVFEAHLAVCPSCVRYVWSYRLAVGAARAAFAPEGPCCEDAPEALVQAVLAASRRQP